MGRKRLVEDIPVSLYPLSFEEALKRMLSTRPVNPAKREKHTHSNKSNRRQKKN
jgi:hypothetical protein